LSATEYILLINSCFRKRSAYIAMKQSTKLKVIFGYLKVMWQHRKGCM